MTLTRTLAFSALAAIFLAAGDRSATAADVDYAKLAQNVLDRIPSDAALFAHSRPGDLLNSPLFKEFRKGLGAEGEKQFKRLEEELGVTAEMINTVTFYYPRMPMGPGDESTFVVAVITNKPYVTEKILRNVRPRDAEVKDGAVKLRGNLVLHFIGERTFAVTHKSLADQFAKGPIKDRKAGPISAALRLAADKHTLVGALNQGALPGEIVTALENQPETRPFIPLYKARAASVVADLGKNLTAEVRFDCENAVAAEDAERCINLLVKLGQRGLEIVSNQKDDVGSAPLMPLLAELENVLKGIKITRNDAEVKTTLTLRADISLAEPAKLLVGKARENAARDQTFNNLKQISLAMHNYHSVHNGFPPAAICDKKGKPLLSWRVAILPYLDQKELYKKFKFDEPWDSEHNLKLAKTTPPVFMIPNVTKPGETNFRVFIGNGAVFDLVQQTKIEDITDGTSQTLMVVAAAEGVPWTKPVDVEFDTEKEIKKLLLWQNQNTFVAMCDGAVRSVSKAMSEKTWKLLIQKADGQPLPNDF